MANRAQSLVVLPGGAETPAPDPLPTDPEAFYRRYAPYVARIGLRILGRDHEVDDLVQDVFISAYRAQDHLRDPGAARGWLATITVRAARRRLQKRKLRAFVGLDESPVLELSDPGAPPEARELLREVYRVLGELPINQRLAWSLRHVEGFKLTEVAEACDCSLATVKRRIAAAQAHIEVSLDDSE